MPMLHRYLGLTQTHLATLLGTTRWAVAQAEAGTRFLTMEAREAQSAMGRAATSAMPALAACAGK
jgi:DNA-binding XRE family transcriptional regulator